MTIVIDYDNDAVRISSNLAFAHNVESKIITIRMPGEMNYIKTLLCEIINVICENKNSGLDISLLKQDEGQLTTIEEY